MTLMIRLILPRSTLNFKQRTEMKDWVRDNGGYSRGATVGGKVGVEFVFFDEESSVAFCLTFGVSPDKCVKGIKK